MIFQFARLNRCEIRSEWKQKHRDIKQSYFSDVGFTFSNVSLGYLPHLGKIGLFSRFSLIGMQLCIECIWSNFMRMHIGLKICHFLHSVVSITGGPKNKIMRKSVIHSYVPCWDSALEQFLFYRVSGKNAKSDIFWSHSYSTIHQYFWTPSKTKIVLKYCPDMGQNYGCHISS